MYLTLGLDSSKNSNVSCPRPWTFSKDVVKSLQQDHLSYFRVKNADTRSYLKYSGSKSPVARALKNAFFHRLMILMHTQVSISLPCGTLAEKYSAVYNSIKYSFLGLVNTTVIRIVRNTNYVHYLGAICFSCQRVVKVHKVSISSHSLSSALTYHGSNSSCHNQTSLTGIISRT